MAPMVYFNVRITKKYKDMSQKNTAKIGKYVKQVKAARASSIDRLRSMRVVVPSKQQLRRSGAIQGVIKGVATDGPQGPERKKYDNQVSATAVSTLVPYIASTTSAIAQGTGISNRIGGRIKLRSLDIECNVSIPGSATPGSGFIDLFIVWDKQPGGSLPGVGAILVSTSTNLTFSNLNNLERFVILRRQSVNLDTSQALSYTWKDHIPLDLAQRFGDATGMAQTNDIYVVAVSPSTAATNYTPSISYVARVTFTDD